MSDIERQIKEALKKTFDKNCNTGQNVLDYYLLHRQRKLGRSENLYMICGLRLKEYNVHNKGVYKHIYGGKLLN